MLEAWEELDCDAWARVSAEPRGKREKLWCSRPGDDRLWLRKKPHRRLGEHVDRPEAAIEAFTLRVARASGLRAPESVICTWSSPEGRSLGIAIRSFLEESGEELSLAAAELRAHDASYEPRDVWQQTLSRVAALVTRLDAESPGVMDSFFDVMAFDAWIGVADRHPENWGLIRSPSGAVRLAPIFDTAACLGVELSDSHRLFRSPTDTEAWAYAERCPSGFGDGAHGLPLAEVAEYFLEIPRCRERFRAGLRRLPP